MFLAFSEYNIGYMASHIYSPCKASLSIRKSKCENTDYLDLAGEKKDFNLLPEDDDVFSTLITINDGEILCLCKRKCAHTCDKNTNSSNHSEDCNLELCQTNNTTATRRCKRLRTWP